MHIAAGIFGVLMANLAVFSASDQSFWYKGGQTFGASVLTVRQGGTGVGTFSSGQLLYGAGIESIKTVATTTVSCSGSASCTPFVAIGGSPITISATGGSGGSGTVGTSTVPTVGQLAYWTSSAFPSLLGSVATTSLTATGALSLSQPVSVIGSSASVISLSTTGDWTGTLDGFEASALIAAGFSTTSANYWETQQTARTADDLTNNSIEDLSDVAAMTKAFGNLLSWNGSAWTNIATSTLRYSWSDLINIPAAFSDGTDDGITSIATTYPVQGGPITTTGTISLAFGTTTANSWNLLQSFTSATATNFGITNSLSFGGVTGNSWDDFCTSITGSADLCDGNDASGGAGSDPNWLITAGVLQPTTTLAVNARSIFSIQDWTVSTTTTVCAVGCEFTSIPTAIASLGSSGGIVEVKPGTYTLASTLAFGGSNITLRGAGPGTVINCNPASANPCIDTGAGSGYVHNRLFDFKLVNTGTAQTGIGVDFNETLVSSMRDVWIDGFATSTSLVDSLDTDLAFYNNFYNIRSTGTRNCMEFGGQANNNNVYDGRCATVAGGIGYYIASSTHNVNLNNINVEPASGSGTIGVKILEASHNNTIRGGHLEENEVAISLGSDTHHITIENTFFYSTVANAFGICAATGAYAIQINNVYGAFSNGNTICGTTNEVVAISPRNTTFLGIGTTTATTTRTRLTLAHAFSDVIEPMMWINNYGPFASAYMGIGFDNGSGAFPKGVGKLGFTNGAGYTASEFMVHVADAAKALQKRFSVDVTGRAYANFFTATSTTAASVFPFASSTALSATTLCLSSDCRDTWPVGGSGNGLATSTAIADTWVIYGTSAGTVGAEAAFNYDDATNLLTLGSASTTLFSASYASSTRWHGGGLTATCASGSFLTWTGGQFGCDTDDNTTYTAGDALTLTGNDIDFDGGATPAGDLGGTWASPSVTDDSHNHTGATISGLDISDDTNLTAGDGLTLTGDDLDCDTATGSVFGCLTAADWTSFNGRVSTTSIDTITEVETLWGVTNILIENDIDASSELAAIMDDETGGTGNLVFSGGPTLTGLTTLASASSTLFSTAYASSTQWRGGGLLTDCDTAATSKLLWDATTGQFSCGTDQTGAGGGIATIQENDGDVTTIATVIDFGLGFDVTGATGEGDINLDLTEYTGNASTTLFTAVTGWFTNVFIGAQTLSAYIISTIEAATNINLSAVTVKQDTYPKWTWPGTATTTTATTTVPIGQAMTAEAWNFSTCRVTSGTGGYRYSDGSNAMNYVPASTTAGRYTLSTNNTFTLSENQVVEVGPLTGAQITCGLEVTVNN